MQPKVWQPQLISYRHRYYLSEKCMKQYMQSNTPDTPPALIITFSWLGCFLYFAEEVTGDECKMIAFPDDKTAGHTTSSASIIFPPQQHKYSMKAQVFPIRN